MGGGHGVRTEADIEHIRFLVTVHFQLLQPGDRQNSLQPAYFL